MSTNHMEIERKWLVSGWPSVSLPLLKEEIMRQGYLCTEPTVRIREENIVFSSDPSHPAADNYILCFKSAGTLSRREIEFPIEKDNFKALEELIGLPLIPKIRRTYLLPGGLHLEVNHVDEGASTEFWYAEIEYSSTEQAEAYRPASDGLDAYLDHDVTGEPGQTMGAYWKLTRLQNAAPRPSDHSG